MNAVKKFYGLHMCALTSIAQKLNKIFEQKVRDMKKKDRM